jgi:hypothetical protein
MALPPTMYLQIAVSALGTAIGVFALRISARARAAPEVHRVTWRLTGLLFLLLGVDGLAQCMFGSWAILAGVGSPVWNSYLRWSPALNYSRTGPEFVFAGMILATAWRGTPVPRHPATGAALLLAGGAVGLALGWLEGPLESGRHYERVAILDGGLFAVWTLAMSAAVLTDVVDRTLLATLVLCVLPLPLNVIWFSWLARVETGVWVPRPFDMQLYHVALKALVLAVALRRWRAARIGIPVPGLAGRVL